MKYAISVVLQSLNNISKRLITQSLSDKLIYWTLEVCRYIPQINQWRNKMKKEDKKMCEKKLQKSEEFLNHQKLLSYLTLSYLILSYLNLSYFISSYFVLPYLILSYLILSHLISSYLILFYFILSYLIVPYLIFFFHFISSLIYLWNVTTDLQCSIY